MFNMRDNDSYVFCVLLSIYYTLLSYFRDVYIDLDDYYIVIMFIGVPLAVYIVAKMHLQPYHFT